MLQVECDEFAVQDFLVSTGYLRAATEDRAVVSKALAELIDKIVKEKL